MIDNRRNSFPGEVVSDFLQENKNYFAKLEEFANNVFEKIHTNNRSTYIGLCNFLNNDTYLNLLNTIYFICKSRIKNKIKI